MSELSAAIETACMETAPATRWTTFFNEWLRRERGWLFVFRVGLQVTDLQIAEFLSLVGIHATNPSSKRPIQLHSLDGYKQAMLKALDVVHDDPDRRAQFLARYGKFLEESVALHFFESSCVVYAPPTVQLAVSSICLESGYIASAGPLIYARPIWRATQAEFEPALRDYLAYPAAPTTPESLPCQLIINSFALHSQAESTANLTIASESQRLHADKMIFGGKPLFDVMESVCHNLATFGVDVKPVASSGQIDPSTYEPLWLLADTPSTPSGECDRRTRHYLCYAAKYIVDNPTALFDESKPAWKSQTTLPHSFTGALINIARRHSPPEATYCDPFCGTGTLAIELERVIPNPVARCGDTSAMAALMYQVNRDFFAMSVDALHTLKAHVAGLHGEFLAGMSAPRSRSRAHKLFHRLNDKQRMAAAAVLPSDSDMPPGVRGELDVSQDDCVELARLPFNEQVAFFLLLRQTPHPQDHFAERSQALRDACKAFCTQLDSLIAIKGWHSDTGVRRNAMDPRSRSLVRRLCVNRLLKPRSAEVLNALIVRTADATRLDPNTVDIVICDPPYGVNEGMSPHSLEALFDAFFCAVLGAIRDRGQLMLCLPAETYTGQNLPLCTYAPLIAHQLHATARACGKLLFHFADNLPAPFDRSTYYWESSRSLRRCVLHYRVLTHP